MLRINRKSKNYINPGTYNIIESRGLETSVLINTGF